MSIADESLKNTGPTCPDGATCEPSRHDPGNSAIAGEDIQADHSPLISGATPQESNGAAILSAEGSHAKTSVSPALAPVSTANEADFGPTSPESFARYDPDTCLWRTSQRCLFGGWIEFSESWPRAGTMRNGMCWQRATTGRRTFESVYSFLLPTPRPCSGKRSSGLNRTEIMRALEMWTTPAAAISRGSTGGAMCRDLRTDVRMWPTPASRDYRHPNGKSHSERGREQEGEQLPNAVGGPLNPTWVEWLMGFPAGWTDLEDSETQSCPK